MALPLALDAELEDRLAGRVDAQLGRVEHLDPEDVVLAAGPGADDLGEAGHADPEQPALLLARPLLLAELLVAELLEREVHRRLVVARVVDSKPVADVYGNWSGWMKFRRRSSAGSIPSSYAAVCTRRSTKYDASVTRNEQR